VALVALVPFFLSLSLSHTHTLLLSLALSYYYSLLHFLQNDDQNKIIKITEAETLHKTFVTIFCVTLI